jgi:hypothetical protein
MDSNFLIGAIVFAVLLAGVLAWLLIRQRRQLKAAGKKAAGNSHPADIGGIPSRQLQLQAYERLILLTDRIALPNLIQRVHQPGLSAWDALRNYKDQNMLIVNQVGSFLPEDATGNDLNRQLLDLLMQNPKASLQNIVSEALSFEAKRLF